MAATMVIYRGISEYDTKRYLFDGTYGKSNCSFAVVGMEKGTVKIDPMLGCHLDNFSNVIAGCFSKHSNFKEQLHLVYGKAADNFKAIEFEFNTVTLVVTEENAEGKKIAKKWEEELEEQSRREKEKHQAWLKTPEGKAFLKKEAEKEAKQKAIETEILHLDETTEVEFNGEEGKKAWDELVKTNSNDPYGRGIIKYARLWAKYMQKQIFEGKTVAEIAEQTSYDADIVGMSGASFGFAVSMLARCWKYGEELRAWHNGQYGYAGDGVVNPAVLVINEKG